MSKYDDDSPARRGISLAAPAAFLSLFIGIVAGGAVGYAAHALLAVPEVVIPPPQVIKDEISDEDLANLCSELTEDEKTKVQTAQRRVDDLQQRLAARESELEGLRKSAEGDEAKKKAAGKKWREMEEEVASLRVQLAEAESERDTLRTELKATLVQLDKQILETKKFKAKAIKYQKESTANLWSAFNNNAKVQICDRGTRNRHEKCHEAVEAAFSSAMQERFSTCVDSYQAVPVLRKAEKDEVLPQFADWLPDDNKFTKKGWYVVFCDPTLPEAGDPDLVGGAELPLVEDGPMEDLTGSDIQLDDDGL